MPQVRGPMTAYQNGIRDSVQNWRKNPFLTTYSGGANLRSQRSGPKRFLVNSLPEAYLLWRISHTEKKFLIHFLRE
ncbi:hypothetical protein Y032_0194g1433 [Ancylostoma ceylanicum]|uniref:Uncharacterized protein n=1 Tax=Ancylostoma ceylanicum TaxID=53326 RepID=A0A016SQ17_9BILA|nr:hypothetical protein Y032_0194g1433 [Ancylostoma ceylanicum]